MVAKSTDRVRNPHHGTPYVRSMGLVYTVLISISNPEDYDGGGLSVLPPMSERARRTTRWAGRTTHVARQGIRQAGPALGRGISERVGVSRRGGHAYAREGRVRELVLEVRQRPGNEHAIGDPENQFYLDSEDDDDDVDESDSGKDS
mmetsp:Transcript_38908/g.93602  ORF Transcript_38908/g.93602 Transcript_38908/m.93602 type:complete len:147 (+) Transcript_38908:1039-1479(+)